MTPLPDMEFVKNFTPPDFQAKNFYTLNFSKFQQLWWQKHKEMSENGEIYTAGSDGMDTSDSTKGL